MAGEGAPTRTASPLGPASGVTLAQPSLRGRGACPGQGREHSGARALHLGSVAYSQAEPTVTALG